MENNPCEGLKILVVDDNFVNQEMMKDFFESQGIIGDFANDGQNGIDRLKESDYDVCLMDITMPVMDGLEASKIIRDTLGKDIPIFIVSALDKLTERVKGEHREVNEWIEKPIDFNVLIEKILLYVNK